MGEESLIAMIRHLHSAPTSNMTSCDIRSLATQGKFAEIEAEKVRVSSVFRQVEDVIDTHSLVLERVMQRKRAEDVALFDELIRVKKAVSADVAAFGKAAESLDGLWKEYVRLNASVATKSAAAVTRLREVGDLIKPVRDADAELKNKTAEIERAERLLQDAQSAKAEAADNLAAKREASVKDLAAKFVALNGDAGTDQAALSQMMAQAGAPVASPTAPVPTDGTPPTLTSDDLFKANAHVSDSITGVRESVASIGTPSAFLQLLVRANNGSNGTAAAKPAMASADAVNAVIDGFSNKDINAVQAAATATQNAKEAFQQRVAMLVFLQKDIAIA